MSRPKIIIHNHYAKPTRDSGPANIIYNKLLGGWYVVTGPHQTPISGKFSSKEEAREWLASRSQTGRPSGGLREAGLTKFQRDSSGAFMGAERRQRDARKLAKTVQGHNGVASIYELDDGEFEVVFPDGDKGKYPSLLEATKQAKK